jgi:hypothetical protein
MTQDLIERIATANRRLLRSSAELLETADRMKQDRAQLLELLRQADTEQRKGATDGR